MPSFSDSSNTVKVAIQTSSSNQGIDETTKSLRTLRQDTDSTSKSSDNLNRSSQSTASGLSSLAAVSATAGVATHGLLSAIDSTISSANTLQSSLTGLSSIATAFGGDAGKAKKAAQELAKDGLMTVADAATGLKNLLAAGFNLDQATTLMNRFKDSAAFGRQASLGFGQAIASATEGIKNGNSILVDNAGVTKNLSNMLVDAGYSAQDLSKASDDAGVRMAIFNGIVKETNAQTGDAAKLADSAAGKQAVWAAQTEVLKQEIGESLQPALLSLLQTVTPIISSIADWVDKNPKLASGIIIGATAITGLITVLGSFVTAVGLAESAYSAFSLLVRTPITMPALVVTAALASIALVANAVKSVQSAIEAMNSAASAKSNLDKTNQQVIDAANKAYASGDKAKGDKFMKIAKIGGSSAPSWIDQVLTGTTGKFATGTKSAPGGMSVVGENGPELVDLPAGSKVYNTRDTSRMMSGSTLSIAIQNFNVNSAAAMEVFLGAQDSDQWLLSNGLSPNRSAP